MFCGAAWRTVQAPGMNLPKRIHLQAALEWVFLPMPFFEATQGSRVLPATELLSEFTSRLEREFQAGLARTRDEANGHWGRAIRALVSADPEAEWIRALLDAAEPFAGRIVLFLMEGSSIKIAGTRNITGAQPGAIELAQAPAFATAISTRDTVIALRTASELSGSAAGLIDGKPDAKCWLVPIIAHERAIGVLYADGHEIATNALEALAGLAGASFRGRSFDALPGPDLSPIEQALDLRAQRFARVRAAEILLYHADAVHAGRATRKLYGALREQIDCGREDFRRDFLATMPSMPDYFHWELVRTLANDDVAVLGEEYPGPLL